MKSSVLLLLFALAIYSCQPKEAVDILITHAEVIDVESGQILSDRMIGIKEGSIVFISDDYSRKYNATQTIEADGKFVIPGLWDMHIHFRGGEELIEENKNLIPLFTAVIAFRPITIL